MLRVTLVARPGDGLFSGGFEHLLRAAVGEGVKGELFGLPAGQAVFRFDGDIEISEGGIEAEGKPGHLLLFKTQRYAGRDGLAVQRIEPLSQNVRGPEPVADNGQQDKGEDGDGAVEENAA